MADFSANDPIEVCSMNTWKKAIFHGRISQNECFIEVINSGNDNEFIEVEMHFIRYRKEYDDNNNQSLDINSADTQFLIYYCSILHLIWILRHHSWIPSSTLFSSMVRNNLQHFLKSLQNIVFSHPQSQQKNTFEHSIINRFDKYLANDSYQQMNEYVSNINSDYFESKLIPILQSIKNINNGKENYFSNILDINIMNIPSLNEIIIHLFQCKKYLNFGYLSKAILHANELQIIFDSNSKYLLSLLNECSVQQNIWLIELYFLAWSMSMEVKYLQYQKYINENMIELHAIQCKYHTLCSLLQTMYCSSKIFKDNTSMFIVQKMGKTKNENRYHPNLEWLDIIINKVQFGSLINMYDIRSLLNLMASWIHYFSGFSGLSLHEQIAMRNQLKRIYRINNQYGNQSTRRYVRCILALLRCGWTTNAVKDGKNCGRPKDIIKGVKELRAKVNQLLNIENDDDIEIIDGKNENVLRAYSSMPYSMLSLLYLYLILDEKYFMENEERVEEEAVHQPKSMQRIYFVSRIIIGVVEHMIKYNFNHNLFIIAILICAHVLAMLERKVQMEIVSDEYLNEISIMRKNMQIILEYEWQFANQEFMECNPKKRVLLLIVKQFRFYDELNLSESAVDILLSKCSENSDVKLNSNVVDKTLKTRIVDWSDFLFVS